MNIYVGEYSEQRNCMHVCVAPTAEDIYSFNTARLFRLSVDGLEQLDGKVSFAPDIDYADDEYYRLKIIGVDLIEN